MMRISNHHPTMAGHPCRGYTTGTFDMVHEGHFHILRHMRQRCDHLTVGLTTDALGARQKRPPVLSFAHRQGVLRHCRHVDAVVAHEGETKAEAHRRLHFDVLFIGSDYAHSPEYTDFARDHPRVQVVVLPRTQGVCTSDLWAALQRRCWRDMSVLALSLSGPILHAGDGTVLKPVHAGATEFAETPALCHTADAYGVGLPEPRNWKGAPAAEHVHPNLPGVCAYRELLVSAALARYPWYPVRGYALKHQNPDAPRLPGAGTDQADAVRRMVAERRRPRAVYWLEQRHGGEPWSRWARRATDAQRAAALAQLRGIMDDLKAQGVVHGDVHGDNVCVDAATGRLTLLDFGWCLWRGFALAPAERDLLERRLAEDFDWRHFEASTQI